MPRALGSVGPDAGTSGAGFALAAHIDIHHTDPPATFAQALHHGTTHIAGAQHQNLCGLVHEGMRRLARATDIKMPRPTPMVTMAVPP